MSRLMSRGAVLTFSRVSNFGVLLISPLFLVRILEVEGYGQFQEFMIYATLLVTLSTFSLDSGLTYFVPKYESLERLFLTQTSALVLALTTLCVTALLLSRPLLLEVISYDFVLPLAAYVFCFVNLNWLENFWIAKRRTDLVLYYSAARVVIRVGVLILVAYISRDVPTILWSIVGVEAVRLILVATWLVRTHMFTLSWRSDRLAEQLRFSLPLGVSSLVHTLGRNLGKLFIGATLGPASLAYYAVASYLLPVVQVIRHSIADVVFPELVRAQHDPVQALRLWQRTNVMFCVLLFPVFSILVFFSNLVITTLFTAAYLPAVPVFQVYLLWILRRCFNMDVLLRSRGKTGFVLIGTAMVLAVNLALIYPLYIQFGLVGPAIAFIAAEIMLELYYASRVQRVLGLRAAELVDWAALGKVAAGCLAGAPLLVAAGYLPGPELFSAGVASAGFIALAWFVAYRLGVTDIGRLVRFGVSLACAPLRRA